MSAFEWKLMTAELVTVNFDPERKPMSGAVRAIVAMRVIAGCLACRDVESCLSAWPLLSGDWDLAYPRSNHGLVIVPQCRAAMR